MNIRPRHPFRENHAPPATSPDGYIRLRLSSLDAISFVHLFSESDDGFLAELQSQTVPARRAGFSEWVSDTIPPVSIGWGWFIHCDLERIMLAPDGVRSNVMLVDLHGYDLGMEKTTRLFGAWLNALEWQPVVGQVIDDHASPC